MSPSPADQRAIRNHEARIADLARAIPGKNDLQSKMEAITALRIELIRAYGTIQTVEAETRQQAMERAHV